MICIYQQFIYANWSILVLLRLQVRRPLLQEGRVLLLRYRAGLILPDLVANLLPYLELTDEVCAQADPPLGAHVDQQAGEAPALSTHQVREPDCVVPRCRGEELAVW